MCCKFSSFEMPYYVLYGGVLRCFGGVVGFVVSLDSWYIT